MNRRFITGQRVALIALVALIIAALAVPFSAQAQKANVITISFTQEPDSLNPMYSTQYFSGLARNLTLKGAWDYDDQLNLVPVLAKEIPSAANGGISADGKVITIKLREDAVWSDGTPITSDDFVFTAEMYASEKNAPLGRSPFNRFKASAPDKFTVVATFDDPYAPWPSSLFGAVLPAHILRPVFTEKGTLDGADWNSTPTVASGPFVLKEYQKGQFMLFERNDKYVLGAPKLDQVLLRFVADDAAQIAAVKAGDSDMAVFLAATDAVDLRDNAPVNIITVPSGYNEGWFLNQNPDKGHPALRNVNVRRAISFAVNREELTVGLLNGLFQPSKGFWDTTPFIDPTLEAPVYDAEAAKKMLDEAGWRVGSDGVREKDGVKLKLRYATNSRGLRKDAQRVIEEQLKQVGIAVELINHPNQGFLSSYADNGPIALGDWDIAQWSISPRYPDPDTSRFLISEIGTKDNDFVGANWAHIRDEALDKLMQEQRTTIDAEARMKLFHQISRIVREEVYWLPLWQDPDLWGVNKRISEIKLSGGTPWWNVHQWVAQ
jgi:peptide/nickel transport system substrate-binding protein